MERRSHWVRAALGGVVVAVSLQATELGAQGVAAADAQPFVGKWTLTLQPPAGGFGGGAGGVAGARPSGATAAGGAGAAGRMGAPLVLDVVDDGGLLKATIFGGLRGDQGATVSSISRSGESLVLSYTLSGMGQSVPASVRLTPGSDGMNAVLDLNGMFSLTGTATKQ